MNANDSAAFIANFAADSIVHDDEGHEHRGTAADTWQFFRRRTKLFSCFLSIQVAHRTLRIR